MKLKTPTTSPPIHWNKVTWQKKCSGSRATSDLIDRLNDGSDEKRGAELEAASDAIASIVKQTDTEMDQRTKLSNRSPRPNPMLAKIPIFQDCTAPAVDNGYCDAAADSAAYSLRSSDTYKAWAQPHRWIRIQNDKYRWSLMRYPSIVRPW